MRRRTALLGVATALSGCTLAPDGPSTNGYPSSPPTFLGDAEWLPEQSAYRITFEQGNTITGSNTGTLSVYSTGAETLWAGDPSMADDEARRDVATGYPVEPGDSLVHEVDERDDIRVVWRSPDGSRSVTLAAFRTETAQ